MVGRIVLLVCFFMSVTNKSIAQNFKFHYQFNSFSLYNGEHLTITPTINYSESPIGSIFTEIQYFLDGKLIAKTKETPFELDHLLKNYAEGTHTLKIAVYATGTNIRICGPFYFDYPITILGTLNDDPLNIGNNLPEIITLANNYYKGNGVKQDYKQAFYWYKKAAELGSTAVETRLAYMYFNAQGTDKNVDAANYWYKKAAVNGSWYAWGLLSYLYIEQKNFPEALFCAKKAAENTTDKKARAYGRYLIGYIFERGLSVPIDIVEAKRWYRLSADEGETAAIKRLKDLGGYEEPDANENLAKLTWLGSTTETTQKNYNLKIGVKSSSKIEDAAIIINDEVHRGLNAVINDGYTSKIEKTLSLGEGNNLIKVVVKNSAGTSSIEKNIVLKSNYVQPASDKRIALIIGNSNYKDGNKLANPVNDATDIASKLETLGFDVIKVLDQTKQGMETAMMQFGHKAAYYDVALFYYAGHGVRYEGVNYLVPVNADLPDETSIKYNCTNANIALDYMEKAKCKMKIVILDACRNNPFERSWHRGLDGGGLSFMSAPAGTFIAFSTAPGDVAADGMAGQRNSPYTSALLEMLDKPNVSLTDFFQEVLEKVARKTNNKQTPWTSNSFIGKFYFNKK